MRTTLLAGTGALGLLFSAACGGNNTGTMDLGHKTDMETSKSDMTMTPPMLTIPGTCTQTTVTASSFYSTIITPNCAVSGCHNGATPPNYSGGAAAFRTSVVGVQAIEVPTLDYVQANTPNNSFFLYKITGQQGQFSNGGVQMPNGQAPLSATDQCTLINWVRSGAN
jgi:hypothetical protein